ncbi:MAG: AtpZ/AtpI family protein [Firmicutes bacterium]|nr:AtpZ/AtpI family protein [Bacillota bacterium]
MKFNRSVYQALTMIGQFGINMLVPVFICSFLGMFLDRKLGTNFLVVILFFVGAVAGGYNVYRFARQIFQSESDQSAYLHKSRRNRKDGNRNERKDYQD